MNVFETTQIGSVCVCVFECACTCSMICLMVFNLTTPEDFSEPASFGSVSNIKSQNQWKGYLEAMLGHLFTQEKTLTHKHILERDWQRLTGDNKQVGHLCGQFLVSSISDTAEQHHRTPETSCNDTTTLYKIYMICILLAKSGCIICIYYITFN